MPKNIMIFSDGTGQVGGMRPDQRLSNVYKMYRAMRPGPSSPIKPSEQVCFYDPGLGSGDVGGLFNLDRLGKILDAAVGSGIDDNVIDCYEKIISYYEPGDRVMLFGFSRGAYTVRAVANVMNLCGIPTRGKPDADGSARPVPRHGPALRKIASDAVNYVYNHGTGKPRGQEPYFSEREELGRRFRVKYASSIVDAPEDVQGNVQPTFIGVFDTVAALGIRSVQILAFLIGLTLFGLLVAAGLQGWSAYIWVPILAAYAGISAWYVRVLKKQFKYFSKDENTKLSFGNPKHWPEIWRSGHRATWDSRNYDKWLDSDVGFARHAMAIDEHRKDFPRVGWGMPAEARKNANKSPAWLKQVWFAGCHSDVGGSYPESESRLSDIALDWMVTELQECVPEVQINEQILVRSPDARGMQHEEIFMFKLGSFKIKWNQKPRKVSETFEIHPSVFERLRAEAVSHNGEMKPYRPEQLEGNDAIQSYVDEVDAREAGSSA